jgi:cardiolipin synthase
VHLEYFIIQPDDTGKKLFDLLIEKAAAKIEVRVLYDAIGSRRLTRRMIRSLRQAGGQCEAFLSVNPFRRRYQINMRNHRKIAVIDGQIGFTGGANIGNEYLGKDPTFGCWRDEHLRIEGPAVAMLQQFFAEDWNFATGETLKGHAYFPDLAAVGDAVVQAIDSGPDQEINGMRETLFAAFAAARERLWIASPYFVPDGGLLDALRHAAWRGVDVRLLVPLRADHWMTQKAARYYWSDLMQAGMKIYEYSKGMMHAKTYVVDKTWALVGSANLDNRSLHLNFEAGCALHAPDLVEELARCYEDDLKNSIQVDAAAFAKRPFGTRLVDNICRLFSPIL